MVTLIYMNEEKAIMKTGNVNWETADYISIDINNEIEFPDIDKIHTDIEIRKKNIIQYNESARKNNREI